MAESVLSSVLGQAVAIATLERALGASRVHHAYLFDGPDGVGKQLAAFGLAQALVCEAPGNETRLACGRCSACARSVLRPEEKRPVHPDVIVLERGLYEPVTIGRKSPETQDLSIDQVRTLVLARASFSPHEGRAKVFIIRGAEELSIGAANALLKTLEEPLDKTHFILITSRPNALLSTIRSRTQRVRFGPLPDEVVASILEKRGLEKGVALEAARLAAGSVSRALKVADDEATREREAFIEQAMATIDATTLGPLLAMGDVGKKLGREPLEPFLEALSVRFGMISREATFAGDHGAAVKAALCYSMVARTIRTLDGNASPQLAMESLCSAMHA